MVAIVGYHSFAYAFKVAFSHTDTEYALQIAYGVVIGFLVFLPSAFLVRMIMQTWLGTAIPLFTGINMLSCTYIDLFANLWSKVLDVPTSELESKAVIILAMTTILAITQAASKAYETRRLYGYYN